MNDSLIFAKGQPAKYEILNGASMPGPAAKPSPPSLSPSNIMSPSHTSQLTIPDLLHLPYRANSDSMAAMARSSSRSEQSSDASQWFRESNQNFRSGNGTFVDSK
jgi:hypothetical protein